MVSSRFSLGSLGFPSTNPMFRSLSCPQGVVEQLQRPEFRGSRNHCDEAFGGTSPTWWLSCSCHGGIQWGIMWYHGEYMGEYLCIHVCYVYIYVYKCVLTIIV